MVLALDLGDLSKKYARAMEHLATVRDGSAGEPAKGYWLCSCVAAHPCGSAVPATPPPPADPGQLVLAFAKPPT